MNSVKVIYTSTDYFARLVTILAHLSTPVNWDIVWRKWVCSAVNVLLAYQLLGFETAGLELGEFEECKPFYSS